MANYAIIDSHAHLDYPQLAHDLPAVLARANGWRVACNHYRSEIKHNRKTKENRRNF